VKIKHLKRQLRTFTLHSGKSLYLYPYAEAELSEQDYYLSKKLQKYAKEEKSVKILEYDKPESNEVRKKFSGSGDKNSVKSKPKKGKKFKSKKSSYLEEKLDERTKSTD